MEQKTSEQVEQEAKEHHLKQYGQKATNDYILGWTQVAYDSLLFDYNTLLNAYRQKAENK